MRLFFIDENTSDRLKGRSNSPMILSMVHAMATGLSMHRVGMIRFWCHIVKHTVKWKQIKGRRTEESKDCSVDLVQPILDEIEKAEKRDQSPDAN